MVTIIGKSKIFRNASRPCKFKPLKLHVVLKHTQHHQTAIVTSLKVISLNLLHISRWGGRVAQLSREPPVNDFSRCLRILVQ